METRKRRLSIILSRTHCSWACRMWPIYCRFISRARTSCTNLADQREAGSPWTCWRTRCWRWTEVRARKRRWVHYRDAAATILLKNIYEWKYIVVQEAIVQWTESLMEDLATYYCFISSRVWRKGGAKSIGLCYMKNQKIIIPSLLPTTHRLS